MSKSVQQPSINKRTIFFVSDGTGITAETLGYSLLTQFENIEFEYNTIPYVNTLDYARNIVEEINNVAKRDQQKPLVFATLVNAEIHNIFTKANAIFFDFFETFLGPLEKELKVDSSHTVGRSHGVQNYRDYMIRMDAVNYALTNDDGASISDYNHADFILVGVSRCGKTPTCLYAALQFGLHAANYPFTEEDMHELKLPKFLLPYRHKLFGLTLDPLRLSQIRQERKPNSRYASLQQCTNELRLVKKLFIQENIPFIDSTHRSIEEIATAIMLEMGIKRRLL